MNLIIFSSFANGKADEENNQHPYSYGANRCQVYDPYERFNRKVFAFNTALDNLVLRPLAKGYIKVTSNYIRNRVESFTGNISEPLTFVNYAMQGNYTGTMTSFWRFIVNSTLGIGGLFDVASKMKLKTRKQTLGNTLARYGVPPGPYIMLPVYGGVVFRDITDPLLTNDFLNPLQYQLHGDFKIAVTATQTVDSRAKIMPFTDYVTKNSTDPYITVRNAIFNQRESKMTYPANFKCPVIKK